MGDDILVFGHPQSLPGAVLSKGILNGKQPGKNYVWLQTDAKTQPGSSGGAWVNNKGKIVGIHSKAIGPIIQGVKINEGMNFAVPIDFVKPLLSKFKNGYEQIDYETHSLPAFGTTIEIKRTAALVADLNPHLLCEELGAVAEGRDLFLCKLYRTYPDKYEWILVDRYNGDLILTETDDVLSQPPRPQEVQFK